MAIGNKGNTNPKTLFKEEYCKEAENYAFLGVTDAQLAGFFKVTERTILTWKKKYPQFLSALKRGRDIADAKVVKSLYQRAIGYKHKEDKIFQYEGSPVVVPTVKHYPPDPVACIYWLNNRQPDKWKNRWEGSKDNNITVKIVEDGDSN